MSMEEHDFWPEDGRLLMFKTWRAIEAGFRRMAFLGDLVASHAEKVFGMTHGSRGVSSHPSVTREESDTRYRSAAILPPFVRFWRHSYTTLVRTTETSPSTMDRSRKLSDDGASSQITSDVVPHRIAGLRCASSSSLHFPTIHSPDEVTPVKFPQKYPVEGCYPQHLPINANAPLK